MIRHGRTALDSHGIADLHGLTFRTARIRKPWAQPGHPRPINGRDGRPAPGTTCLWDAEQARAYAAGEPVPPMPGQDHPLDLLDATEAAAMHDVTLRRFVGLVRDHRLPPPDTSPHGVDHWRRSTVETMSPRVDNPVRRRPTRAESAALRTRLDNTAAAIGLASRPVTISELTRTTGVTRVTARNYLADRST